MILIKGRLKVCLFLFKQSIKKSGPFCVIARIPAEGVGFEPTIPLRIYYLSRVASSTTPAPVRIESANIEKYSVFFK